MIPQSIRYRGVHFAYLFGPPRTIERNEASQVFAKVCDALHFDDFSFKYLPIGSQEYPESRGFAAGLERQEGRGRFVVMVDNKSVQEPVRLKFDHVWPAGLLEAERRLDAATGAVFEHLEGQWQLVLAEARLRAQCNVEQSNAMAFFQGEVFKLGGGWWDGLGKPLTFTGAKFEAQESWPDGEPLRSPKRVLSIEVSKENPNLVYLEVVSTWPQFPASFVPGATLDMSKAREILKTPSKYIEDAKQYLEARLRGFGNS